MNLLYRLFGGEACFLITGAAPQEVLNRLSRANIMFWDIERQDELHYRVKLRPKDGELLRQLALERYCEAELLWERSMKTLFGRVKKRPILAVGLLLALFATFFFQRFVWVAEVKGAEDIPREKILRLLQEQGIGFGTCGSEINSQQTKLQMLSRLPELSWLAVNRRGGKLTVLLTEKDSKEMEADPEPSHLVALRDGVIREFSVLEGMRLFQRGDTVRQGQLLVSGLEDYGLYLKAVAANGEIYAETWHRGSLAMAASVQQKVYTGREFTAVDLILGRKRINLCGNSGIFTATCDKMVSTKTLTLPNYSFPVQLEISAYREYTLKEQEISPEQARRQLEEAWENLLYSTMVAGRVVHSECSLLTGDGIYVLSGQSRCHEMIARRMPMEQVYEGE